MELLESGTSAHEVDRRATLRARLGECERSRRKLEGRERDASEELTAAFAPPQSARDHQMNYEVQITLDRKDDSLPQAVDGAHPFALDVRHRRLDRSQHERTQDFRPLDRFIDHARCECLEVRQDVGELGHAGIQVQRFHRMPLMELIRRIAPGT